MTDKIKDLVDSAEEISEVPATARGAWDIEGLKEALRQMFPKKPGSRQVLLEKVMAFHSTGDIKHRAHYAKKAIERAVEELGWKLVAIRAYKRGGKEYIAFTVDF